MNQRSAVASEPVESVLAVVEALARELHPDRPLPPVTLDTRLDRDLGFDSLARVELMSRVEQATGRSLPEEILARAETPRDLLDALSSGRQARPLPAITPPASAPSASESISGATYPSDATTLVEVLEWHARLHPEQLHIVLVQEQGAEQHITYGSLLHSARTVAGVLTAREVQPGDAIAVMLPTSSDYFAVFCGILLAGAVPVPLYPPLRASQLEDHLQRQVGILSNCQARMLVTTAEVRPAARLLMAHVPSLKHVLTADELQQADSNPEHATSFQRPPIGSDALALLQYTSGSTGNPKGVMLTHANLLANLRAMGRVVQASSADVFVSWLPLYHDMGLIGAWLGSLYYGMRLVAMSPLTFLSRPAQWLRAIHRHRGTLSAAPNSAYELCLRKIADEQIEGLDLSSWRLAFNGAEAVSPDTITAFTTRFSRYGFARSTMAPVYGLAECCVGLAFPPLGRGPVVDSIDREVLLRVGRAQPLPLGDPRVLRTVACGRPMPEHEIRIVDETGHELGDRMEGRLQFKGPSATQGYFRNPEATRDLLRGDWLDSGDLAYTVNGEIYITGRTKDIIIRAGRHLHPEEIERAVGEIPGVRRGCVAVFGSHDARHGTERLVILAETRERDAQPLQALRARISEAVLALIGEPPDDVALVAPHVVPKTSSGKLRRQASRALYESGGIDRPVRSARWQAIRFAAGAALPLVRRSSRAFAALLYAAYAWVLFGVIGTLTLLCVLVLPGLARRRSAAQRLARVLVRLARLPLRVNGPEHLPVGGACVVVCNHASYADAVALIAALPLGFPYSFMAKRELAARWAMRVVLQRLGSLFVERADIERSVSEIETAIGRLRRGDALVVFPEGTLRRTPGLLPFHLGGFVAAATAGVAVVPIAIRGTRNILRADQWFPRRGPISVSVAAPVAPSREAATPFAAAVVLRDAARKEVLKRCGEADLED